MIYEIRDYHYRRDIFDAYRAWAEEAVPVLKANLDIVGFWIDEGAHDPQITGTDPFESPIGTANVTWVIRWESREARDEGMKKAFTGDDWKAVWARHPDPNGYRQMSARFMTSM